MIALRRDFDNQRTEWIAFRTQMEQRFELVSLNDLDPQNVRPYERGVTVTDAQRILLKATITNTETRALISAANAGRTRWWDTSLGRLSTIIGIIAALVLILGTIYEDFIGLSHSIIPH